MKPMKFFKSDSFSEKIFADIKKTTNFKYIKIPILYYYIFSEKLSDLKNFMGFMMI